MSYSPSGRKICKFVPFVKVKLFAAVHKWRNTTELNRSYSILLELLPLVRLKSTTFISALWTLSAHITLRKAVDRDHVILNGAQSSFKLIYKDFKIE